MTDAADRNLWAGVAVVGEGERVMDVHPDA